VYKPYGKTCIPFSKFSSTDYIVIERLVYNTLSEEKSIYKLRFFCAAVKILAFSFQFHSADREKNTVKKNDKKYLLARIASYPVLALFN